MLDAEETTDRVIPDSDSAVVRSHRLVITLAWIGGSFLLVGTATSAYLGLAQGVPLPVKPINDLLYPDFEANLFSWFSAALLATLGISLGRIAVVVKAEGRPYWPFAALAITAIVMSADEVSMLHERLFTIAEIFGLGVEWTYQWLVLGVPLAIAAGVVLLFISRSIEKRLRNQLVVAGSLFLLGALGFEALAGVMARIDLGLSGASGVLLPHLAIFFEEGLEVAGVLVALWATLAYVRVTASPTGLTLSTRAAEPALR